MLDGIDAPGADVGNDFLKIRGDELRKHLWGHKRPLIEAVIGAEDKAVDPMGEHIGVSSDRVLCHAAAGLVQSVRLLVELIAQFVHAVPVRDRQGAVPVTQDHEAVSAFLADELSRSRDVLAAQIVKADGVVLQRLVNLDDKARVIAQALFDLAGRQPLQLLLPQKIPPQQLRTELEFQLEGGHAVRYAPFQRCDHSLSRRHDLSSHIIKIALRP